MSYKYKESIKDAVNEVYSASFADELNRKNELDEVYRKAAAFDDLSALIAKRYEAEKDRAGYTADQYTQGVYYTLNNLNGVARDLERGDGPC